MKCNDGDQYPPWRTAERPRLVKGAGAAGGEYTPKQQAERPWGQ